MAFRRAQSDEEKSARLAEKEQQRELKVRQKAVADEQNRLRKEAEERERQRQAFLASPAGLARTAFDRGDRLFQFVIDVSYTSPVVIPMVGATTTTRSTDPVAILNSVCNEGWDLVNGSFVFHELGSESRDKFLASGQNIAVKGTVVGYYLFKRCPENKVASQESWNVPVMERSCPHCGTRMNAAATLCPQCHSQSEPWRFHGGVWWRSVGGKWLLLDTEIGEWRERRGTTTEPAAVQPSAGEG